MAKSYIFNLFSDEGLSNVGLEEVEFDEMANGLSPLAFVLGTNHKMPFQHWLPHFNLPKRSYKVVRISDIEEKVLSVKNHGVTVALQSASY
ncbi:MAG: hypothetical protein R2880_21725 [Deinococcales bacterium]